MAPDFSSHSNPFPSTAFKKAYKSEIALCAYFIIHFVSVCPVKETAKISFIWSLPPMQSHYKCVFKKLRAHLITA